METVEQLSLFDDPFTFKDLHEFFMGIYTNQIEPLQVANASRRAYDNNPSMMVIIPIGLILDIPAWRKLCKNDRIQHEIETADSYGLYAKLYDGKIIDSSHKMSKLVTYPEAESLYKYVR